MGVSEASITCVEGAPVKWCDTRSLASSGRVYRRIGGHDDVARSECSMPLPAPACAAGNDGVRSPGFNPKGLPPHLAGHR
jgi:hypothetical protein